MPYRLRPPPVSTTFSTFPDEWQEYLSLNTRNAVDEYDHDAVDVIQTAKYFPWLSPKPVYEPPLTQTTTGGKTYGDAKWHINDYYDTWAQTTYSEDTEIYLKSKMKNIMIPPSVLGLVGDEQVKMLPYYVDINIPTDTFTPMQISPTFEERDYDMSVAQYLATMRLDDILLSSIKKHFVDRSAPEQSVVQVITDQSEQYKSEGSLKYVDFNQMLLEEANNPTDDSSDFLILTDSPFRRQLLDDPDGNYRYVRTTRATDAIVGFNKMLRKMGTGQFPFPQYTVEEKNWNLLDFLAIPGSRKPQSEIIAFRIEKTGYETSPDATSTSTTLQNFYFFNTLPAGDGRIEDYIGQKDPIRFIDTQVKYGETYTYNIYAYKLLLGYRYTYKDFKVSLQQGKGSSADRHCLQFYDTSHKQTEDLEWISQQGTDFYESIAGQLAKFRADGIGFQDVLKLNLPEGTEYNYNDIIGYFDPLIALAAEHAVMDTLEAVAFAAEVESLSQMLVNAIINRDSTAAGIIDEDLVNLYNSLADILSETTNSNGDPLLTTSSWTEYALETYTQDWMEFGEPVELLDENLYATNSEVISSNPYIAEMVLEVEPYIKLYEVPFYSRDITILDNPPRQVDVTPFQRQDNSQVVGFYLRKRGIYRRYVSHSFERRGKYNKGKIYKFNELIYRRCIGGSFCIST